MVIDNDKKHILSNYKAVKKNGKAVDSAHYTLYVDLELKITKKSKRDMKFIISKIKNLNNYSKLIRQKSFLTHVEKHRNSKWVCEECGKQTKGRESLKIHAKIHSRKIEYKNLNRKTYLNKHKSIHTEGKLYQCTYCGKTFLLRRGFKNHLRIHRRVQKNSCETCNNKISSIDIEIATEEAAENTENILKQFKFLVKILRI